LKKPVFAVVLGQVVLDTVIRINTSKTLIGSQNDSIKVQAVGGPPSFTGATGFILSQLYSWTETPLVYAYGCSKAKDLLKTSKMFKSLIKNLKLQPYCPHFRLIYNDAEKDRILYLENPPVDFDPKNFNWDFNKSPVAIVGSVFHEFNQPELFSFLRDKCSYIAFDPQGCFRQLSPEGKIRFDEWSDLEIMAKVDCLKISETEAKYLNLGNDKQSTLKNILETSISTVLLTRGVKGAILGVKIRNDDKIAIYNIPAYPSDVIDETGAGDIFLYAYVVHFCTYSNVLDAVAFATSVTSILIEQNRFAWHLTKNLIEERQEIIRARIEGIFS
jgi:hypothetical protein